MTGKKRREFRLLFLLALPVVLTVTNWMVFTAAARWFGQDAGYVIGFVVYWGWCLLVPWLLWGKNAPAVTLAGGERFFRRENWLVIGLLGLIIAGAVWAYFLPGLPAVTAGVLLFSPVAILTGTCEEILWRGVYGGAFGRQVVMGWLYPAAGFAVSHLAPLQVYPAEAGNLPFLVSTLSLGLVFGWAAQRNGTARWTAVTHSLIGLLAFGEPLSSSLARLFGL